MSYIFLLISLGLLFLNIYVGFILSIVALIISIIQFKKKDFLNTITFILSSLVIVICIISFITSSYKKKEEIVEEALDENKKNSYISYEQKLEGLAKSGTPVILIDEDDFRTFNAKKVLAEALEKI